MSTKIYNTRRIAFVAMVLLGILYLVGAFFVFTRQDYDKATNDMRMTMQYIKSQYLEFQKLDTASEAKSLARMRDKMNQLSLMMGSGNTSTANLQTYTDELRLTGMFLLNEQGELLDEYNSENISFADLKKELLRKPVLDVAKYPQKLYTRRIILDDSSYIDIGAHKRMDAPGIVVCYYHTPNNFIENYNLSVRNIMSAYNRDKDGTIIISNGYKVIASNDTSLDGTRADQNKMIEALRSNGHRGELIKIAGPDGKTYYGSLDRGRDFFAYIDRKSVV